MILTAKISETGLPAARVVISPGQDREDKDWSRASCRQPDARRRAISSHTCNSARNQRDGRSVPSSWGGWGGGGFIRKIRLCSAFTQRRNKNTRVRRSLLRLPICSKALFLYVLTSLMFSTAARHPLSRPSSSTLHHKAATNPASQRSQESENKFCLTTTSYLKSFLPKVCKSFTLPSFLTKLNHPLFLLWLMTLVPPSLRIFFGNKDPGWALTGARFPPEISVPSRISLRWRMSGTHFLIWRKFDKRKL